MTTTDTEKVAAAIRAMRRADYYRAVSDAILDELAKRIADVCAEDNPHFDRGRFIAATTSVEHTEERR